MKRRWLALLVGLAAIAAGPPPPPLLPVPPIPPTYPPPDQAAPVPDAEAHGVAPENQQGLKLSVTDFRMRNYDASQGYAMGSHFQTSEDKRVIQTPGLTLRLPLQ